MESKKMMLVLIAIFALAAFASAAIQKDVITEDAINALSKSNKFPNEVIKALSNTKTVVPNLALWKLKPPKNRAPQPISCGETCKFSSCFTRVFGCRCINKVCHT